MTVSWTVAVDRVPDQFHALLECSQPQCPRFPSPDSGAGLGYGYSSNQGFRLPISERDPQSPAEEAASLSSSEVYGAIEWAGKRQVRSVFLFDDTLSGDLPLLAPPLKSDSARDSLKTSASDDRAPCLTALTLATIAGDARSHTVVTRAPPDWEDRRRAGFSGPVCPQSPGSPVALGHSRWH